MTKKNKAIYEPGEFDRIRKQLGVTDPEEAKRMAGILGGEIGTEKNTGEASREKSRNRTRNETVDMFVGGKGRSRPKHRVELLSEESPGQPRQQGAQKSGLDPGDDPSVPLRTSYRERVKMDRCAGQPEFEIKTVGQVLYSMLAVFGELIDYVNPAFVIRRLNEYYKQIELLVTATRNMFPRNNMARSERLRKTSTFSYAILDTIRYWNVDRMASDLARLQAKPRIVKTNDLADFLRAVYRPLYCLEKLNVDTQIKDAYKLLFKILYLETPTVEVKRKYEELVKDALGAYAVIQRDIRYLLYPLLLKLCSDQFIPYEDFFTARKNRIASFLKVSEADRITPNTPVTQAAQDGTKNEAGKAGEPGDGMGDEIAQETKEDPEKEEENELKAAMEAEDKAVKRGLNTLEIIFPRAGWDRLTQYPDLYPYFHDVFKFKKGYELIAPTDPLQQVAVLMRILEEMFIGLRYVTFTAIPGPDGGMEQIDEILNKIIGDWHYYVETAFEHEYIPRLTEYCRILDSAAETRTSTYARRLLNELHWVKRLYFLPYYRFESTFPPSIQKKDVSPIYPIVRKLRKHLTAVAAGIEQGNRRGGAEKNAHCDGIENPWEPYNFEVPNPISLRMNAVLGGKSSSKQKTNASLIFFTLSAVVVLDYLMNTDRSWAYEEQNDCLFRSINGEGIMPLIGVDTRLDTESIFSQALKQRERKGQIMNNG